MNMQYKEAVMGQLIDITLGSKNKYIRKAAIVWMGGVQRHMEIEQTIDEDFEEFVHIAAQYDHYDFEEFLGA